MNKKEIGFHGADEIQPSVQSTMAKFKAVYSATVISVVVGSVIAVVGFLSSFDKVVHFHVAWWTGALAYVMTLWVPGWALAKMRMMHLHYGKESPDTYDAFTGLTISKKVRRLVLVGLAFSLFAIYVAILPFAEMRA